MEKRRFPIISKLPTVYRGPSLTVMSISRLAFAAIHDQRVLEHPEVDEAATPVQLRNLLAQIACEFGIVELAVARPRKPSGFVSMAPTMSSSETFLLPLMRMPEIASGDLRRF